MEEGDGGGEIQMSGGPITTVDCRFNGVWRMKGIFNFLVGTLNNVAKHSNFIYSFLNTENI